MMASMSSNPAGEDAASDVVVARHPKAVVVTRDVSKDEPNNFLGRDVKTGEVLYRFTGATYGCIAPGGEAVSERPDENPFFEFPEDAI